MYEGKSKLGNGPFALYEREKAVGYKVAAAALDKVSKIVNGDEREEALDVLIHDADDLADMGKVSRGWIRGWRQALDDWHIEREESKQRDLEALVTTTNAEP